MATEQQTAGQHKAAHRAVAPDEDEPTIGRLVHDASRDISTLISKEIQLAKAEIKTSVNFGLAGAIFFAAALFILVLAIIMLSVAFAYLIHWNGSGLDLHWAFLIVFGAYTALAGLCAALGVKKVKQVRGPERAIEQGKEIPAALRGKV
ncbi:phage holin family protein [Nocardioides sp. R-C-SC26]|uniref:phage holin family protein n=1 Tax=Nocardioides sp. R-C-SC26 TaxID=2870414 RepID=UPI001E2B1ADF|nr:phage holin family protein [Nocardioides sp. R-C-SC26]